MVLLVLGTDDSVGSDVSGGLIGLDGSTGSEGFDGSTGSDDRSELLPPPPHAFLF